MLVMLGFFSSIILSIIGQRLIFISGNEPTSDKKDFYSRCINWTNSTVNKKINIWQDFWILGLFPVVSSLI